MLAIPILFLAGRLLLAFLSLSPFNALVYLAIADFRFSMNVSGWRTFVLYCII